MKKLLAVVLAAATVLSLGVSSFAAEITEDQLQAMVTTLPVTEDDLRTDTNGDVTAGTVLTPDTTYYHMPLPEIDFLDKDNFKVKYDKGDDNGKMIKSITFIDKDIGNAGGRKQYVEIKLAEDMTDNEYKLTPSVTVTFKKYTVIDTSGASVALTFSDTVPAAGDYVVPGTKLKMDYKLWMSNKNEDADRDYSAGTGGVMLKPQKNEDNEITWEDEISTLARLTFVGDSSVNKIFPKLSTKWENADYAEFFADQDAFIFDFVGNAKNATTISSTSRAVLELYNPYYDADEDELRVDPEDVIIYQVDVDGTFTDVTASFKATENDDGDSVFTTKTRELGTYIFAEKVAGTVVDDVVETPDDKVIPNTGR